MKDNTTEKKPRQTGKKTKYAYTIKDKFFPNLLVLNTANAWWLDRVKVGELIKAFKIDATIEEACVYAGISIDQYKYFVEQHPEFSTIKKACRELPTLKARETVNIKMKESYSNAMDYLKRKKKDEFGGGLGDLGDLGDGEKIAIVGIVINPPDENKKNTSSPKS